MGRSMCSMADTAREMTEDESDSEEEEREEG